MKKFLSLLLAGLLIGAPLAFSRSITRNGAGAASSSSIEIQMPVTDFATNTATGDGQFYFRVTPNLNGKVITGVKAQVITAGTTNATNVDIARCAETASGNACSGTVDDVLSTNITIDSGENSTDTAAAAAVIDTTKDDLTTDQILRVDVDGISTTPAKGLIVILICE